METIESALKIELKGLTVSYTDSGLASLPVIFIHGFPFTKKMWEPQVSYLENRFRVITYDIRGFGNSTGTTVRESIKLFADDLINMMNALDIEKAIICGLSMGGYIVLNAVHHYPERFKAIILSDTQCIADSAAAKDKRNQAISHIIASGLKDFTDGFAKTLFYRDTYVRNLELVEDVKKMILSASQKTVTGTLLALADRPDMCSSLNTINVPALILCGSEDVITSAVQAEFLHNNIKGSVIRFIEKAGHLSNLEQPEIFNKFIDEFISRVVNEK